MASAHFYFILPDTTGRYYRFIREFAVEVVRERFVTLRSDLHYDDFDAFYNAKAEWHEELEKNSLSTRNKLRQVLFRMLREADLLTKNNVIKVALLTPRLVKTISIIAPVIKYLN
jgi:hypothetical protein